MPKDEATTDYRDANGPIPDRRLDFYDFGSGEETKVSPESKARMNKYFEEQNKRIAARKQAEKSATSASKPASR